MNKAVVFNNGSFLITIKVHLPGILFRIQILKLRIYFKLKSVFKNIIINLNVVHQINLHNYSQLQKIQKNFNLFFLYKFLHSIYMLYTVTQICLRFSSEFDYLHSSYYLHIIHHTILCPFKKVLRISINIIDFLILSCTLIIILAPYICICYNEKISFFF